MAKSKTRLPVIIGIVLVTGFLAVRFLEAAGTRAHAMRTEACQSLGPKTMAAGLAPGKPAPDFELADQNGKKWKLSSLRGKPVLINFWATWCAPCVEEMPSIENLKKHLGDDLTVLAVSVDEDWDVVKKFFPKGTSLPVLLDTSKDVPKRFGTEKYPETFLVDSQGNVQTLLHQVKWDGAEAALCLENLH